MRFSIKTLMLVTLFVGMGVSIATLAQSRKRLRQQINAVILMNQDLIDDHERMKVVFDARENEVKRLRDERDRSSANADSAEKRLKTERARFETQTRLADERRQKATEEDHKLFQEEIKRLEDESIALKKEVAALKAKGGQ